MLTSPYFLCLAVSLQIYHANFSNAFTLPLQRSSGLSTSMTALNMRSEDNFFDIEAAREQLESMVTSEGDLTTERQPSIFVKKHSFRSVFFQREKRRDSHGCLTELFLFDLRGSHERGV